MLAVPCLLRHKEPREGPEIRDSLAFGKTNDDPIALNARFCLERTFASISPMTAARTKRPPTFAGQMPETARLAGFPCDALRSGAKS
jgi:hypothetical protein